MKNATFYIISQEKLPIKNINYKKDFKEEKYFTKLYSYEILACKLASKYWRSGKRILINCENKIQAQRLDKILWQRIPEEFIPHNLVGDGPKDGAPVELAWPEQYGNSSRDLLINLLPQLTDFTITFHQVIDFVPCEENLKQLARERYKSYRRAGFRLITTILPT
ncbi:DNA polymerase III subunit chi [Candidatus Fukatsuia anoeciicola]|uniref:DNA polymerase III subunit chi n=1 Tax=Candidatus Fukatsuia anoeciicola TaxID=2994492 RepID=UPI0034649EF6